MAKSDHQALGLVETKGLVAALEAADTMTKAARVRLVGIEQTVGALMTVQIVGETAAVQSAVDAGRVAAERVGELVATHVIPRPTSAVERMQLLHEETTKPSPAPGSSKKELESMTVRELRALARKTPGITIQGRQIARANKKHLIDALRPHF
ncbi:MAG: hypothetical protein BMS9Abin05_0868 [Rhodothermia bacterium]|nr:MAG: hypothetical protein BMS9Abin05_0868 [Rhodothermia bacterium]